MFTYDELPYPNYVFSDTHPARIAAAAKLFGLSPANVESARILEIGCGAGLNVITQAATLPEASFYAIDTSAKQIAVAKDLQQQAGIKNIDFVCQSIEHLPLDLAKFDYIICHGVFSWVGKAVQHEILLACNKFLTEHGVAFISYNTLPGWNLLKTFRDLLKFSALDKNLKSAELITESKELLKLSSQFLPKSFLNFAKPQLDHWANVDEGYLAHEFLADFNEAFYFTDFVQLLEQHGLAYLAESDLGAMLPREYQPSQQEDLLKLAAGQQIALEQYLDFFRLRQFRKTLICKERAPFKRQLNQAALKDLFVALRKTNLSSDYGGKDISAYPQFNILSKSFPAYFKISDLLESHSVDLDSIVAGIMLDDLEVRTSDPFKNPLASSYTSFYKLMKVLAASSSTLPNLRSESVLVSDSLRQQLASGQVANNDILKREMLRLGLG